MSDATQPPTDDQELEQVTSREARVVLRAIRNLERKLDLTLRALARRQKWRWRFVIAYITVALLAGGMYLRNDQVQRCERRNEIALTIRRAIHQSNDALPQALLEGFGETEDVQQVVDVINAGYDDVDLLLEDQLPIKDCGGIIP